MHMSFLNCLAIALLAGLIPQVEKPAKDLPSRVTVYITGAQSQLSWEKPALTPEETATLALELKNTDGVRGVSEPGSNSIILTVDTDPKVSRSAWTTIGLVMRPFLGAIEWKYTSGNKAYVLGGRK